MLEEMDLDAILARRPQIVLVDELAHTNAPGSRHPKRVGDVEELLARGIDVYTTVNIQHLESLNDVVAQITGVRVRETIPDAVLDRADEVKLIDLSPEELLQRLREGKVYMPAQAERAIRNYFKPSNLTALRELALRETAEHVDDQMQAYMRELAVDVPWPVAERIMVAVSGGPALAAPRPRRAAHRRAPERALARRVRRDAHVPRAARRGARARRPEPAARRAARRRGGHDPGEDVADELVRYARERNVTELVLGKPGAMSRWQRLAVSRRSSRASSVGRVDRGARDRGRRRPSPRPPETPPSGRRRRRICAALAFVAAAGGVSAALSAVVPLRDHGMVFLAAVLLAAVVGGLGPSITAAVASSSSTTSSSSSRTSRSPSRSRRTSCRSSRSSSSPC
jgi:two-component system sensor histidine kinase KdpD